MCVCASACITHWVGNRFPEADAKLVTEDVQQDSFASLQTEEKKFRLSLSHQSRRRASQEQPPPLPSPFPSHSFQSTAHPLVLRTEALISCSFSALVAVLYFRGVKAPAERTEKVAPEWSERKKRVRHLVVRTPEWDAALPLQMTLDFTLGRFWWWARGISCGTLWGSGRSRAGRRRCCRRHTSPR